MRVAVVFFGSKKRDHLLNIAKGLAKGIESQGNIVDVIDGMKEPDKKLTVYQYIVIGTETLSPFGGKILENIPLFLSNCGHVMGKASYAFLPKGFGAEKTLSTLMQYMEGEGMFVRVFDILSSSKEAEAVGKKLKVEKINY